MGKVITTWVLDLAESKSGLQDLVGVVETYNTTVAKAAQTAKQGFTDAAQSQVKANQTLAAGIQQQATVTKAVEATTAAVLASAGAEGALGKISTEASDKAKNGLDENIKRQKELTKELDATAAAAERSKGGGIQMPAVRQIVAPVAPLAPATAVVGAVPSASVAAVTEEFSRQIALAAEASKAAQAYFQTVSQEAAGAKLLAASANDEARETKRIYEANKAEIIKVEEQIFNLQNALKNTESVKQQDKLNASLERALLLQSNIIEATESSRIAYSEASGVAASANVGLNEKIALQQQATALVKQAAEAEKGLQLASRAAIAAANEEARASGLIGGAEMRLTAIIEKRKLAQSKPELAGINREIDALNKEIDAYKKVGSKSGEGEGGFFSSLAGQLATAAAGFFTLQQAYRFFTDGLKNAADLAGIKSTFNALSGSIREGNAEFGFIEDKSKELGLDLISTANGYKVLYAAAKEADLGLDETRKIFSAITAEGKVLGLSNQQVESSLLAVSQMLGKGTVASQELKLQLGNALPDASAQAARALGVTTKELNKMLEKGQIIAKDFLPKFAAQIQKTYGGATADAATQLQSNLNRISNSYKKFSGDTVGALAPAIASFASLVDGGETLAESASKATTAYERQAAAVQELQTTIPGLVAEAEALQKKTSLNADEQARLAFLLKKITDAIPGASKGFDAYGISLGLNTEAVAAYIKNNAKLADRLKADALRQNKELLEELTKQANEVTEKLNDTKMIDGVARLQRNTQVFVDADVSVTEKRPFPSQKESDEESARLLAQNAKLISDIARVRALIDGTAGKTNDKDKDTVKTLSIIAALQQKITDLTAKRLAVTEGEVSDDNPNGGGKKQILSYTAEIEKVQAELNKLLDKNQKKVHDTSLSALKALQAEEKKLRESYNKALIGELRDAGQARAAEQLRQDFNEIDAIKKQIIVLEKAYAKKGGKGKNADGKLNKEQQQEIDNSYLLAVERYNEEINKINREANAKILDLQSASDEKELAQLRAKYDEEIRVTQVANDSLAKRIAQAQKDGNKALVLSLTGSKEISDKLLEALKNAAQEQEKLLIRQQALNNIDRTEKAQTNSVNAGILPTVQFNDTTSDGSGDEQAGAAKRIGIARSIYEKIFTLETDLEAKKQRALLQIQIDGNNARIAQYSDDYTKEGVAIKDGLEKTNKGLYDELNKIKEPTKRTFNLAKLLGVDKEHQDEVNKAFSEFLDNVSQQLTSYLQEQVDATTKVVEARKSDVEEKQKDLDTEIDLNKQGFASNVETKRQELSEAKAARAEALKEQKSAIKAQQLAETASQGTSLITASIDIFKGFQSIPFGLGIPLGIAAVSAMFAFFANAKIKAAAATAKLEKGGWIGGKRHSEGGNKFTSNDGQEMEHEAGEFAINRKSANKYADIVQALNADDEKLFASLAVKHLLKGTGVALSLDAPKRLESQKSSLTVALNKAATNADSSRMDRIEDYLSSIKENTKPTAYVLEYADRTEIKEGNRTRIIRKK